MLNFSEVIFCSSCCRLCLSFVCLFCCVWVWEFGIWLIFFWISNLFCLRLVLDLNYLFKDIVSVFVRVVFVLYFVIVEFVLLYCVEINLMYRVNNVVNFCGWYSDSLFGILSVIIFMCDFMLFGFLWRFLLVEE